MKDSVIEYIKKNGPTPYGVIAKALGIKSYEVLESIYPLIKSGDAFLDRSQPGLSRLSLGKRLSLV